MYVWTNQTLCKVLESFVICQGCQGKAGSFSCLTGLGDLSTRKQCLAGFWFHICSSLQIRWWFRNHFLIPILTPISCVCSPFSLQLVPLFSRLPQCFPWFSPLFLLRWAAGAGGVDHSADCGVPWLWPWRQDNGGFKPRKMGVKML